MSFLQNVPHLIVLILSLVMLGIVGYGFAAGDLDAFLLALREPWNQVTLADLYISFWLMSVVMFVLSRNKWASLPWIVAINIIGSPVFGLWLLLNLPRLRKRLG
jgi:hypothetical protein